MKKSDIVKAVQEAIIAASLKDLHAATKKLLIKLDMGIGKGSVSDLNVSPADTLQVSLSRVVDDKSVIKFAKAWNSMLAKSGANPSEVKAKGKVVSGTKVKLNTMKDGLSVLSVKVGE